MCYRNDRPAALGRLPRCPMSVRRETGWAARSRAASSPREVSRDQVRHKASAVSLDQVPGPRNNGRLEAVTELVASVFVPAGLFCLVLHDAHPHKPLWSVLGLIFFVIGTPPACLSVLLRWRRRHRF